MAGYGDGFLGRQAQEPLDQESGLGAMVPEAEPLVHRIPQLGLPVEPAAVVELAAFFLVNFYIPPFGFIEVYFAQVVEERNDGDGLVQLIADLAVLRLAQVYQPFIHVHAMLGQAAFFA
jgi:hypothetical protein